MTLSKERKYERAEMFNAIDKENEMQNMNGQKRNFTFMDNYRFDQSNAYDQPAPNQNHIYLDSYGRGGEMNGFRISNSGEICSIEQEKNQVKTRSRTSPYQLEVLENVCRTTLKPNKETRVRLSKELNMTERQVQIWFQNKRAKSKKVTTKTDAMQKQYGFATYNSNSYSSPYEIKAGYHYLNNYYTPDSSPYYNVPADFTNVNRNISRYNGPNIGYYNQDNQNAEFASQNENFFNFTGRKPEYKQGEKYSDIEKKIYEQEEQDDLSKYYFNSAENQFKKLNNK